MKCEAQRKRNVPAKNFNQQTCFPCRSSYRRRNKRNQQSANVKNLLIVSREDFCGKEIASVPFKSLNWLQSQGTQGSRRCPRVAFSFKASTPTKSNFRRNLAEPLRGDLNSSISCRSIENVEAWRKNFKICINFVKFCIFLDFASLLKASFLTSLHFETYRAKMHQKFEAKWRGIILKRCK